jgi:hypothetical protein
MHIRSRIEVAPEVSGSFLNRPAQMEHCAGTATSFMWANGGEHAFGLHVRVHRAVGVIDFVGDDVAEMARPWKDVQAQPNTHRTGRSGPDPGLSLSLSDHIMAGSQVFQMTACSGPRVFLGFVLTMEMPMLQA